jgi:SAM-dependent methyltransferase
MGSNRRNLYHIAVKLDRMSNRIRQFFGMKPSGPDASRGMDEYDWRFYHFDYDVQLKEIARKHLQKLAPGDFTVVDGVVRLKEGLLPLHANHRCLYEGILALSPKSVLEVGCGGGDHLHNLVMLMPGLSVRGLDRSAQQLALLKKRSPHLTDFVGVASITEGRPAVEPADVVYTQAVIMHIQEPGMHLRALTNMFHLARNQVVMMENWDRHAFVDDIRRLASEGAIPWMPSFYFRRDGERPHLLVASRVPLQFEPLRDYRQLLDAKA